MIATIEYYSHVQLLTDKYHAEGASRGDLGSVIEVYRNGDYEVEFADENGVDFAQIVAHEEELRVIIDKTPIPTLPLNGASVESVEATSSSDGRSARERLHSNNFSGEYRL